MQFHNSEDPLPFELGPNTNAFYQHPAITQLLCPLADVGGRVDSLLTDPVMLSRRSKWEIYNLIE